LLNQRLIFHALIFVNLLTAEEDSALA